MEQANASDINANQGPYSDTENPALLPRRNNQPRALNDKVNIVEYDLIQSSPLLKPVANDALLVNFAN